jgi:predicted naringenin-chalcone synthase
MKIYKDNALNLALSAIQNCLQQLDDFDHASITHVITVSCTGMYAPGIDIEIVQRLNLNSSTSRTAINFMGCYGAFNAIKVANAICQSDSTATVLIVCVEICTIHFQQNMHLDNIISNSIFADGAGAMLVQSTTDHKKYFTLENFYNDLLPQSSQEMAWNIGDNGFDIVLSTYVPDMIKNGIATFFNHLASQYHFTLSEMDYFAIHPGGLKILEACETALNISKEDNRYSYQVLRHFGNMSSVTIIFVLKAIWDDIHTKDHHKNIFSCAFGPGLTLESMILKTHCEKTSSRDISVMPAELRRLNMR